MVIYSFKKISSYVKTLIFYSNPPSHIVVLTLVYCNCIKIVNSKLLTNQILETSQKTKIMVGYICITNA